MRLDYTLGLGKECRENMFMKLTPYYYYIEQNATQQIIMGYEFWKGYNLQLKCFIITCMYCDGYKSYLNNSIRGDEIIF